MELLWKIQNAPANLKNEHFKTMTGHFDFASRKWYLELECKDDNITVNLKETDSQLPIYKKMKMFWGIGLQNADGETLFHWNELKKEYGVWEIPKWNKEEGWIGPRKSDLLQNQNLFSPSNVLTFFVRLSMHPSPFCVLPGNHNVLNNLSKNLEEFYLEDKNPDVKIIVGSETFGAHRTILKARSPVLSAKFSQSLLESETGEIRVEDCRPKDFAVFLYFLYSGTVDNLTSDNVISVYSIAYKYEVFDLMETCSRYMLSTLTVHSICKVIALAFKHDESKLLADATVYFMEHAEEIFATAEWENLLSENPIQANKFLIKRYSSRKKNNLCMTKKTI